MLKKRVVSLFVVFWVLLAGPIAEAKSGVYWRYFQDTYASLKCLRGDNGLILDKVVISHKSPGQACPIARSFAETSPTNIGFDLLTHAAADQMGYQRGFARKTIDRILAVLSFLEYEKTSGLFFNRYSATGVPRPTQLDISSVDNLHLALALWTISRQFPGTVRAGKAKSLLARMDFSGFYRPKTGLLAGDLVHAWSYSFFGSESRSIYAVGWALGLIRDPHFLDKAFAHLKSEVFCQVVRSKPHPILKVWDGGAFQLLLPQTLISESSYSAQLAKMFRNYGEYILAEGQRLGLSVPAAYSASGAGVDGVSCGSDVYCYNGKAGSPALVPSQNGDLTEPQMNAQWDAVFTPHAAILAAQMDPPKFTASLYRSERLSTDGFALYERGLGWMDGYRVKSPYRHSVIPVLLSLDQEMIALSLANIFSPNGRGPSAQALFSDAGVKTRLTEFYRRVDAELLTSCEAP